MTRGRIVPLVVAFVLGAGAVLGVPSVIDAVVSPQFHAAKVRVSKPVAPVGATLTVSASGFEANSGVQIELDGSTVLASGTASATGAFSTSVVVPSVTLGPHTVGASSAHQGALTTLTVSNPDWASFGEPSTHAARFNLETTLSNADTDDVGVQWSFETYGVAINSSPAVVDGVVYFGADDENMYAVNASNGNPIWQTALGGCVESSPTVANGIIYVGVGILSGCPEGQSAGGVFALNAKSGAVIWHFASSFGKSSPVVANGLVYVGSEDDNVYAVNAATGTKVWQYGTGGAVDSSPAVVGGVVYVGSADDNLYALNAATGAKIWQYTTGKSIYSSPAVVNGVVYVGSNDDNVYAVKASTGAKVWQYTTGNFVQSSPAVANGVVYIGSNDRNVYALNATTGAQLWQYTTGNSVYSSPAVANGIVCVGSNDYNLYGLDAATGSLLWQQSNFGYPVLSSPSVVNGLIYIGFHQYLQAFGVS